MSVYGELVICFKKDKNPYFKSLRVFIYTRIKVFSFEVAKIWGLFFALNLFSFFILFLDMPAQTPSQVPTETQGLSMR